MIQYNFKYTTIIQIVFNVNIIGSYDLKYILDQSNNIIHNYNVNGECPPCIIFKLTILFKNNKVLIKLEKVLSPVTIVIMYIGCGNSVFVSKINYYFCSKSCNNTSIHNNFTYIEYKVSNLLLTENAHKKIFN